MVQVWQIHLVWSLQLSQMQVLGRGARLLYAANVLWNAVHSRSFFTLTKPLLLRTDVNANNHKEARSKGIGCRCSEITCQIALFVRGAQQRNRSN